MSPPETAPSRRRFANETRTERGDFRALLEFSLERIREKTQSTTWACFEKHILKGRPAGEVAEKLGMMTGAVYVNASRVLERVRLCAADYMDDDEA